MCQYVRATYDITTDDSLVLFVSRIVHSLADNDYAVERIPYELVDLVVVSLRSMEEHKHLVTNWTALLRILGKDAVALDEEDRRFDAIKQRVVLRMLVRAADLEARETAQGGFATTLMDPDVVAARSESIESMEPAKKKKKVSASSSHEELTLALAKSLPDLIAAFNGETSVMRDLTLLPRYIRKCTDCALLS
jgi:hypothetical protein